MTLACGRASLDQLEEADEEILNSSGLASHGLKGEYFDNADFTQLKLTRLDPSVAFRWQGDAPAPEVGADSFSVRWTGELTPRFSERYTFYVRSDDGVRLWINGVKVVDHWTIHGEEEDVGTLELLAGRRYALTLEYYEQDGWAAAELDWSSKSQPREIIPSSQLSVPAPGRGVLGHYFGNPQLEGPDLLTRLDSKIDFQWAEGSPSTAIPSDSFSVRWSGRLMPRFTEEYTLASVSDDGVRVWLGGQKVIDNWTLHGATENSAHVSLVAGQYYDLTMEYFEAGGGATAQLSWASASQARESVRPEALYLPAPAPDPNEDLTVGWISRLPQMDFVPGSLHPDREGWPAIGQQVTWRANVKNWSFRSAKDVRYVWLLDGTPVAQGLVTIPARTTVGVDLLRPWSFNRQVLTLRLDEGKEISEVEERNNTLSVFTDAISVGFYVERSVYDYFHRYQLGLGAGSNGWEDWAQRQVRLWNEKLAAAHVLDRIRIDEIVIVENGKLPLLATPGAVATNHPNLNDRSVDLIWGFPNNPDLQNFYGNHSRADESNPFFYEGSLFHEIGHARYLIDVYNFDVHGTSVLVREQGVPIVGTVRMPLLDSSRVHVAEQVGLMAGDYSRVDPYSAAALNLIAGQRARRANFNAPGDVGSFINDFPAQNRLQVLDLAGHPLPNAKVSVYQAKAYPTTDKQFDDVADLLLTTDSAGQVLLGRCPFAQDGTVDLENSGGMKLVNGLILLRVESAGKVGYTFLESTGFNLAYWRGDRMLANHVLRVGLY